MSSSSIDPISQNPSALLGHPILEGWLLKKKRKKMQGFARRYFYLSQEPAVLSYSFSPNSRIRDSVLITLASISISRKSRSIHIDSGGSLVMHIKTSSDADFLRWTQTLQSLVTHGKLKERQRRPRQVSKDSSKPLPKTSEFSRTDGGPSVRPVELSNLYHSVARMQAPLSMLEESQEDLRELLFTSSHSDGPSNAQSSHTYPRSRPPATPSPLESQTSSNPSTLRTKAPKAKKPNLFKQYSHYQEHHPIDPHKVYQIITEAITQLKAEHLNLIDLINIHRSSIVENEVKKPTPALRRIETPSNNHTRPSANSPSLESLGSNYVTPTSSISHIHPPPRRRSSTLTKNNSRILQQASTQLAFPEESSEEPDLESEDDTIFHDAADDDIVFVDLDLINNEQETEAETTANADSRSNLDSDSDCSTSEDEDEQEDQSERSPQQSSDHSITSKSISESQANSSRVSSPPMQSSSTSSSSSIPAGQVIQRRTSLPSPVSGDVFSIFSMLKKNVGKDLSQISFPISFNEPLSATQKICEECEYVDELLIQAVKCQSDPIQRLMFVASFVVSGFCHTKTRAIRKPFNPMLGETYECIRPDKGMKFLSEKVVHHPPTIAAYVQGENWKLEINSSARQKFWGQSLEIIPEGLNRLTIFDPQDPQDAGDVYEWDKPSSFVRNLVSGTKYLEHIGKTSIVKRNGEERATIEFKPGSTFGGEASRNKVEVKIFDGQGKVAMTINGKWDSYLSRSDTNQKVFQAHQLPSRSTDYYGFTQFAIELNELTDDLLIPTQEKNHPDEGDGEENNRDSRPRYLLPSSDSRLRPDLRLYENGQVDEAEAVKKELEEKQRHRRKFEDLDNSLPLWFECQDGKNWTYKGGYFETRQKDKPEWKDLDLF